MSTFNPLWNIDHTSSNSVSTNSTQVYARNEQLAKIEIAVLVAILVLAVVSNGIVLLLLGLRYSRLTRMNLMIMHLSFADLFVAFFHVLPQLAWDVTGTFKGGFILCKLVTYFQVSNAQLYTLCIMCMKCGSNLQLPYFSKIWPGR